MPLFEVAILQKPTKREIEEGGATEQLVFGPKPVVARDDQGAGIAAVLEAKEEAESVDFDMNRCEVIIRPFA